MTEILDLTADVLVIGGGPAGAWAALKAAQAGSDVILADKGYCGTSGATASAGTGVWYVPPEPAARESAMASRENLNGHLSDRRWMARVLDQTYANINELAAAGRYPFPTAADGTEVRRGLQGPEYMRRMRAWLKRSGVRILDHSPVLELLTTGAGAVAGAAGLRRQQGQDYRVRAGAVVLATGGCAFLSRALGCDVNTGDGALMAAEVGAVLSGMEFSNAYAIAPEFSSVTKTAYYTYATFYRPDGSVLEGAGSQRGRSVIARALLAERVFCRLDRADAQVQAAMRLGQPNFFLPFDRMRINPFTDRFPITLLLEGTVRGTGGIRVAGPDCSTGVPGLYVAGDAATRELICGGFTGGGSHNSAWAMSSGTWAGKAAAIFAWAVGPRAHRRRLVPAGAAGLRPTGAPGGGADHRELVRAVQAHTHPYDRNYLRRGPVLADSLAVLDDAWRLGREGLHGTGIDALWSRQAAAMVAHARWMYTAALARPETRGMHKRLDHPEPDPESRHRLVVGGLDELWSAPDPVRPHTPLDLAVAA
ncbi:FAD-dependent oxidoreductase [Plantactinospora siamensis]|uniref:L-aspartate oxidase n=1 Tax=Plantactinospora siamensis TaxID=555372 RepID=A0ABV6NS25_9ACTN